MKNIGCGKKSMREVLKKYKWVNNGRSGTNERWKLGNMDYLTLRDAFKIQFNKIMENKR